jgi:hypothetical protein
LEEHHEIPVEGQPEEQQQPATAEGHETEVLEQQQEKGQPEEQQQPATAEGHETEVLEQQQEKGQTQKPTTTPRAIRLATIEVH